MMRMNKIKNKMNKKAIADVLITFYATLFIIIIMLAFLLFFHFSKAKLAYEVTPDSQSIAANAFITNYVKSPVIIDGQQASMADLIDLAVKNETYELQLRYETVTLGQILAEETCTKWKISLTGNNLDRQIGFSRKLTPASSCTSPDDTESRAQIIVPLENPEQYVLVDIYEI